MAQDTVAADSLYDTAGAQMPTIADTVFQQKELVDNMGILKPYSLVLEDDDKEHVGELYVADDDTVIIDSELMAGLDKDLDDFFENLLKE